MCFSYNIDFKSVVMKHAQIINNQDLACKLCVVEQNVQCWKKQKGLLIRKENVTQNVSSNG